MHHVLILLVFLLVGCGGAPPTDKPIVGGRLSQALIGDPDTFNPVLARTSSSLEVTRLLFVGLVGPPDSTGKVQPELAERWQISDDGRRFVFTLRPGLVWSDGDPLDADDVVFTYNQVYFNARMPEGVRLDRGTPPTIRALDARTVEFVLDQPDVEFLNRTEPILPGHLLSVDSKREDGALLDVWGIGTDPTSLVGNGPFICTGYTPGKQLVLQSNSRYWRGPDQPYVRTLDYTIAANRADALAQFRVGKLDAYRPAAAEYATLYAEQGSGNFTLVNSGPQPELTFLAFNLNRGRKDNEPLVDPVRSAWFNNTRFRQAVAYALDREAMVKATGGVAQADTHPFDSARAMSLLEEAGFRRAAEGLQDPAGNQVRFTLLASADSPTQRELAEIVRRDLEGLGIEVEVKALPLNTLRNRLRSTLRWEAVLASLEGATSNPLGEAVWQSQAEWHLFNQQRPQLKGQEVSDWERELDGLLARARTERDPGRQQALEDQMTKIIETQMPLIPTVRPLAITAIRNRVRNFKLVATDSAVYGRALSNIWEVQVDN